MNAQLIELAEDEYEDMLTEIYGTVTVCGMEYDSGRLLREIDPTAFRCGMSDEPERWQCDECDSEFDEQEEAEECCKE